jgi:hypothetical protein
VLALARKRDPMQILARFVWRTFKKCRGTYVLQTNIAKSCMGFHFLPRASAFMREYLD